MCLTVKERTDEVDEDDDDGDADTLRPPPAPARPPLAVTGEGPIDRRGHLHVPMPPFPLDMWNLCYSIAHAHAHVASHH